MLVCGFAAGCGLGTLEPQGIARRAGGWRLRDVSARRGYGRGRLLLLVIKLVYEQSGSSLFVHDVPPVADAHLFGTLGGLTALPCRGRK